MPVIPAKNLPKTISLFRMGFVRRSLMVPFSISLARRSLMRIMATSWPITPSQKFTMNSEVTI